MSITDIYGLQQLITEPTRITPTSATLIDVIYTNCPDKVVCSGVRHISISDHSIVFPYRKLSVNGMSGGHNAITYRNFRKFHRINFRNDITSHCWDPCLSLIHFTPDRRTFSVGRLRWIRVDFHCHKFLTSVRTQILRA